SDLPKRLVISSFQKCLECSSNSFTHDLACATEDGQQARGSERLGNRVLHDVAIAAMQLQCLIGKLFRALTSPKLHLGGLGSIQLTLIESQDRTVNEALGDMRLSFQISQLKTRVLVFGEYLAEGRAVLRMLKRLLEGCRADRRCGHGESQTSLGQLRLDIGQALADFTNKIRRRDANLVKEQLSGI